MSTRTTLSRVGWAVLAVSAVTVSLAACAPEPGPTAAPSSASPSGSASPDPTGSPSPSPSISGAALAVPTDCRAILSESVLSQLDDIPLNDPAAGVPTGVQSDGSLICLWRDPGADTTYLQTEISLMNRGPALDLLNQLADDEGFTCYTPDDGTRCERTWQNEEYPVTDGRTLFYRDDILIDTTFSNLAPSGYTDSLVQNIFG